MTKQHSIIKHSLLSLSILASLQSPLLANPSGAHIINGQVSIDTSVQGITSISNSPGSIINWQDFSIAQGEITRFIQQSSQSAVLNRVIGQNPSQILGQLISNGQVFVINPNGIVFGANSIINTQGLIASTLELSNQDFLSGNYHFIAGSDAAGILNEGVIRTGKDGNIILIAPDIENNGIIQTDGGKITLAAGQELTLTSLDDPQIRFQVQAAENEVLNLGQVLTNGGAIDLFAGTITHSGEINSDSLTLDASGNITFKAQENISLTATSISSANSQTTNTSTITIESETGTSLVSGDVTATSSTGQGGTIHVLGNHIGIIEQANIDASGQQGGGEVLIGGDYQGNNPDIDNAQATYIGQDATVKANAITQGDGGKLIVWADGTTRSYGQLEAKAGELSGDGGFIETSGHYLELGSHTPDTSSTNGRSGTWLLDPENIEITSSSVNINQSGTDPILFDPVADDTTTSINVATINTALDAGSNVTIDTSSGGSDAGSITINSAITKSADVGGDGSVLTLKAHHDINIYADITSSASTLDINLTSDQDSDGFGASRFYGITIDTNGGTINADDVSLFNASNMINATDFNINNLSLYLGLLSLTGNMTVADDLTWNEGDISGGTLITPITATSNLTSGYGSLDFNTTWNNYGIINWLGKSNNGSGTRISTSTAATLNNYGTFNDVSINYVNDGTSNQFGSSSNLTINNYNIWNVLKSASLANNEAASTATTSATFNNYHTVNITDRKFIIASGVDTGIYTISTTGGAVTGLLEINNGNRTFQNLSEIAGDLLVSGGNVSFDSGSIFTPNGTNLLVTDGTVNFNNTMTLAWNDAMQSGGTINIGSNVTFSVPSNALTVYGELDLDDTILVLDSLTVDGTLAGTGQITATNFNWLSGEISGTRILNTTNSELDNTGLTLTDVTWNNQGTVNWNGSVAASNASTLSTNTAINNLTGSQFNLTSSKGNRLTGLINNDGTITKVLASGNPASPWNTSSRIGVINNGTINVEAGLLEIYGDGSNPITDTGNYVTSGTGTLLFKAGLRTISGDVSGDIDFDDADVTFDASSTYTLTGDMEVEQSNVFFNGTGALNLTSLTHRYKKLEFYSGTTLNIGSLSSAYGQTFVLDTGNLITVNELTLDGYHTLTGDDDITVNTTLIIKNGSYSVSYLGPTIGGNRTLSTLGQTIIQSPQVTIKDNVVWNNAGTVNWNKIQGWSPTANSIFYIKDNATFANLLSGTFNDNTESPSISRIITNTAIVNEGNWYKTSVSPTSHISASGIAGAFNNDGQIFVSSGLLELATTGTDSGSYSITGSGDLRLSSARTFVSGSSMTSPHLFQNSTVSFEAGSNLDVDDLDIYGTLTLNTGSTINLADLNVYGILQGSDEVNVSTLFSLDFNDSISGITLNTASTATSTINAIGHMTDVTWNNSGIINWDSGASALGYFFFNGSSTLNNSGTFNDLNNNATQVTFSTDDITATINNSGIWNKNGATPISLISTAFHNTGTVNTNIGSLDVDAAFANTNASPGDFFIAAGASLNLSSPTVLDHPNDFSGTGDVIFGAGQVTFDGSQTAYINQTTSFSVDAAGDNPLQFISFDTAAIAHGTLTDSTSGTASYTANGTLSYVPVTDYTGPDTFHFVIQDSIGTNALSGTMTINVIPPVYTWSGATSGTASWADAANWGGTVPEPGSDVIIPNQAGSVDIVFNSGSLFINTLTANENLSITGGTLTIGDDISDISSFSLGTTLSLSGGTFSGAGTINVFGDFNLSGGTLSGSGTLDLSDTTGYTISGSGNPILNGMTMKFADALTISTGSFTVKSGSMTGVNGLSIQNGASFNLSNGSFTSTNGITIDGDLTMSGGSLAFPGGTLDINGNLNWSGGSIAIGSAFNVNSGGSLLVSGSPSAGTGTITLLNGGLLGGTGTLAANINNTSGNLSAGNSPGTLTIQGNLALAAGSTTTMEITGLVQGSTTVPGGYDYIEVVDNPATPSIVEGNASLNGLLNIITSSYAGEAINDSFNFIQAENGISGAFNSITTTTGYSYTPSIIGNIFNLLTTAIPTVVVATPPSAPLNITVYNDDQVDEVTILDGEFIFPEPTQWFPEPSESDSDSSENGDSVDSANQGESSVASLIRSDVVSGEVQICR